MDLFRQEYPASDEEAFIGSGNPVFPGILVGRAIKAVELAPAPVKGTLREVETVTKKTRGGTIEIPTRVLWVPEADCQRGEPLLRVWEHPRAGEALEADDLDVYLPPSAREAARQQREAARLEALERGPGQYVVAADVAEGESNTFTSGDYHAIHVLDHITKTQVAEYESHLDLHLLARWIFLVALYYNEALLAVERNGPGVAVVEPLKNDLRYRYLYKQRKVDQQQSHKVREKIGWTTDQVTKPELEVTFAQALQEETHGLALDPLRAAAEHLRRGRPRPPRRAGRRARRPPDGGDDRPAGGGADGPPAAQARAGVGAGGRADGLTEPSAAPALQDSRHERSDRQLLHDRGRAVARRHDGRGVVGRRRVGRGAGRRGDRLERRRP